MARRQSDIQKLINRSTGVSSNFNGARGVFRVNAGKSPAGTSRQIGNRAAKYRDIRTALGAVAG